MHHFIRICLALFVGMGLGHQSAGASTLDDIWERGAVTCGIDEQNFGFAYLNAQGEWQGFEVDYCRALAVAVFGEADRVQLLPLNARTRFTALANGDVDVLFRSTTWTFRRDAASGFEFPSVTYYDQLGILAHHTIGVSKLEDVKKATICVASGTTTLLAVNDFAASSGNEIVVKAFNSREGVNNFFFSGQCDLYAADLSALKAVVAANAPKPDDYIFLDANLSKEPLGPVVREDDREWEDIVRWLANGLIEAEERGLTQANVKDKLDSSSPPLQFLLGVRPGIGTPLRLRDSWLRDVISTIGNYGEVFERHLGSGSVLKMERGLNALWRDGGLMYAIPFR